MKNRSIFSIIYEDNDHAGIEVVPYKLENSYETRIQFRLDRELFWKFMGKARELGRNEE